MYVTGSEFSTVTWIAGDVAVRLSASETVAASVCVPSPSVVVFHWNVYGAAVSAVPTALPSTTSFTASGSVPPVTVAVTGIVPCANDQSGGTVSVTVGGASPTENETGADVELLPTVSV